jgi:hypothetical protein
MVGTSKSLKSKFVDGPNKSGHDGVVKRMLCALPRTGQSGHDE